MIRMDATTGEPNLILVQALLKLHFDKRMPRYARLQGYYEGFSKILQRRHRDRHRPNNKLVNNFPGYIVDVGTGYFMGQPISYGFNEENKDFQDKLKDVFDYNDEAALNTEIAKQAAIKGKAYELLYMDQEAQVRQAMMKAEEMIVVYNREIAATPAMAIRIIDDYDLLEEKVNFYIEVYDAQMIYYYKYAKDGGTITPWKEPAPHVFQDVPVIEYLNNPEEQSDFERVITLIDAYDKSQSDSANDFEYFCDAYLKIKNMSGTNSDDIGAMKRDRVILVDGDGDAEWLIKQTNDAATENYKNRLAKDIHSFSLTPNLTDESFAGNLTGVAIKYKLWGLEQKAAQKERLFKKAIQRRIELVCNVLNIKGGNYDWRNITLAFKRNMPQNLQELVEMVIKLKGIVSDETYLELLPFVEDAQNEIEKLKKQNEGTVDLYDEDETKKETIIS